MNNKASILSFSLLLLLLLLPVVASAAVEASLDRQMIREGETVQLTIEVEGQSNSQPDTTPLERDFDLLGTSSNSRLSIVNGRADARTTWTIVLSPKRMGELEIPPLVVGAQQSPPLKLQVERASAPTVDESADIFIESEIVPESPYVQAQLLLRVQLFHAVEISKGSLSDPAAEQVLLHRIGKDRQFTRYKGERKYQVIERLYALFPQSSGELEIAAPVFDGQVPDYRRQRSRSGRIFGNDPFGNLFPTTRQVRVRGKTLALEVRPRPVAAVGGYWLPATKVDLSEEWSDDGESIRVGDPLTRTLTLTAQGLTAAQLPELTQRSPAGVNTYPDKAELTTEDDGKKSVIGHRLQKIAYIPTTPGLLELPEVVVEWWNTENDRLERRVLPARRLQVLPGAVTTKPAATKPSTPPLPTSVAAPPQVAEFADTAGQLWPLIAAGFALAWLVTLWLWWRARSGQPVAVVADEVPLVDANGAFNRFKVACRDNDPATARTTLIAWGAAIWPEATPTGLEGVAERLEPGAAQELILQLDRHLYRGEAEAWDGAQLLSAIKKPPVVKHPQKGGADKLPPLYPVTGNC